MCGIAGIRPTGALRERDVEALAAMSELLTHRGPDDEGVFLSKRVGLAHRRLKIIDLAAGNQPMSNEDGNVHIVFNGEIYNYRELRVQLEARGHKFRSQSDTEVIVHLFEDVGVECFSELRGMFAIAIWDERNNTLTLGRDRLGIKPLFYVAAADRFIFASEIPAIIADPTVPREMDITALWEYFTYGYCVAPRSIYSAVRKVMPGHWVQVGPRGVAHGHYWDFVPNTRRDVEIVAVREELNSRLLTVINQHLISDVPLGAFLSGGMDSSTIVALMREADSIGQAGRIKTCCVGFPPPLPTETHFAAEVAGWYHTDHVSTDVNAVSTDLAASLLSAFGEPFADTSLIPTYLVSKLAREHCTVALSGDGGDELFGGYSYRGFRLTEQLGLRGSGVGKRLRMFSNHGPAGGRLRRFHRLLGHDSVGAVYRDYHTLYRDADSLLAPDARDATSEHVHEDEVTGIADRLQTVDPMDTMLFLSLRNHLHNDMLTKVDRMSMQVSLEVRVPFLDHELVEYVFNLPSNLKYGGWRMRDTKFILKQTMGGRLPATVMKRPKSGFGISAASWRRHYFEPLLSELRSSTALSDSGVFREMELTRLLASRQGSDAIAQWLLLVFHNWYTQTCAPTPHPTKVRSRVGKWRAAANVSAIATNSRP